MSLSPAQLTKSRRWRLKNRDTINIARREWRRENPDLLAFEKARERYGVSREQFDGFRAVTACAICGGTEGLGIDHDHKTGVVRGVLCHGCNTGIGLLSDDYEVLRKAAQYVLGAEERATADTTGTGSKA